MPGVEILRKRTVSQNFYTRKLGAITVIYAVDIQHINSKFNIEFSSSFR